jgi:hypothetical protein
MEEIVWLQYELLALGDLGEIGLRNMRLKRKGQDGSPRPKGC